MLHRITRRAVRTVQHMKTRFEAGRREMALDGLTAYQSETWNAAKWARVVRYGTRLHRIAGGRSPFRSQPFDL